MKSKILTLTVLSLLSLALLAGCAAEQDTASSSASVDTAETPGEMNRPVTAGDTLFNVENRGDTADVYTPAPGSKERGEIMDALRAGVRDQRGLEDSVVFRVRKLAVLDDFAMASALPQRPGGDLITKHSQIVNDEGEVVFEGEETIIAVAERNSQTDRWHVTSRTVGATDYPWRGIFAENADWYPVPLLEAWEKMDSERFRR